MNPVAGSLTGWREVGRLSGKKRRDENIPVWLTEKLRGQDWKTLPGASCRRRNPAGH